MCLWGRSAANESAGQYLSTISGAIPLPRASVTAVKTFFRAIPNNLAATSEMREHFCQWAGNSSLCKKQRGNAKSKGSCNNVQRR